MPRNYKPKPKTYNQQQVQNALQYHQENPTESVRSIARKFGLKKDLLFDRIKGKGTGKVGRHTAIPIDEEQELAVCLKTMSKWGFGLSKEEVKDICHDYVVEHNITGTNFHDNRPGEDWFQGFKARHNLTVKKPEPLEKARRCVTDDPFIIYGFYSLLDSEMVKLNLMNRPECIYNLDESAFPWDPAKTKVVAAKGPAVHRITHGSGRQNTTVLACVNAAGRVLPPLILFEGHNLWSTWKGSLDDGMIKGTYFAVSKNGWMTTAVFKDWFKLFIKDVEERPILLLFDGHMSHLDIEVIEMAMLNNIHIVKLPPHSTDVLQPLDKCCFGPLKSAWDKALVKWQRETNGKMSKSDFSNLLGRLWHTGLSEENVKSGFRHTGIFPLDQNQYPTTRFHPEKLARYKVTRASANNGNVVTTSLEQDSLVVQGRCRPSTSKDVEYPIVQVMEDLVETAVMISDEPRPGRSNYVEYPTAQPTGGLNETALVIPDNSSTANDVQPPVVQCMEEQHTDKTTENSDEVQVEENSHSCIGDFQSPRGRKRSFEELLLDKLSPKQQLKTTRRKIDMTAKVITSEEYSTKIKEKNAQKNNRKKNIGKKTGDGVNSLEQDETQRNIEQVSVSFPTINTNSAAPRRKGCQIKRRYVEDSSSDESDSVSLQDSSGDSDFSEVTDASNLPGELWFKDIPRNSRQMKIFLAKVQKNIAIGKLYCVYYEQTFYIGRVQSEVNDENGTKYEVRYLKWLGDDKYWWPSQPQIETVKSSYIFYGPVETVSVDPFRITNIETVKKLYNGLKRCHKEIFTNIS